MIRLLPQELRCRLRSEVTITHVTQCVEEMVMNSLDAGANCIAVRIDLSCLKIQVVDNGTGISSQQLEVIGKRYFTSKCHEIQDLENLCYFGYRGEALASLKDMAAILDITTRTRQSSRTYCKMFQRGSSLSVFESAVHRPSAGTTVTVHDLFYNLPVRKKAVNESLELERIRHRMEGIALIHTNISFSLRNDVTGHIILQTHKSSCIMTAFTYLFGPGKAKCLSPVSSNHGEFQVEGYMGKEPHYNKELQFIYINGRMVLKTKIHKLINKILSKSLVFKRKPFTSEGQVPVNVNSSPTKQNEKYSIFVLNVKCPLDVYDITFDPAKTLVEFKDWAVLTSSIESMVWRYLKKENLISLADSSCLILNPDKTAVDSEKQCTDTQVFVSDGDAHESETGSKRNSDDSNKTGDTDSVDSILIEKESKSQTQCIENIGDRISTHTMMQSLHSQLVTRTSCVKDDQNNTKETEENQHDKSSESDIAGVDNDPHGHVSSEPLVSTHKSDGSSISIPSALSSVAATVSVSSDDGGKATVSCISISDVESKNSDSDITAAESCGGSVVDSCLKTPVRPTVHVCVSPMIAAAPSTTTCSQTKRRFKSADNYQISTCDSDVETEDPLISPLKIQCTKHRIQKQNVNISNSMYGRNQKTELCRSDEGSISPCPEDPHGLEQPAVTNRVKPKIHETLSRLFSRNARVNKISHITLTPEKRRASGSFRQKISEKLAADGFIDPAFKKVCNLEDPSSNTGQIKHIIPKNTVPMSELEKRIHIGQGGGGKASSSLGLNVAEENQYQSSYLLQAESPLHFSVPSCSTVKQVDKTQNAQQHHGRCQHTVTTQTSPDLQKRNTGKVDTEYGVRKRFHPPCRYSSVASKLSKLVQANAQNETKGNGSCEKESSGMRFRFMTSTSFFETPRTVFKRLSEQPIDACCVQNKVQNLTVVHVDDGNKSQSSNNLTFAQQNIQQPIQLDDTVINMQLNKSFCHIQNSSREPVSTIDQEAGLRTNPMLPEASQGFNMPNECETHAETNTELDPLFRSQGFNIPSKFGISEDPSQRSECYSLAFDVSCRPVINSHPSKSSEFHSHGFSLSPLEFETAEPVKETTSSCRYYETQQLTPPVTMEKTGELALQKKTSLFCDIFTPLESGADNLLKSAMLDSQGKTCSSQGPGVNDRLSSEIPCGQRPECSKSDADLCEISDTSPLNSLLSKQSESTETLQADLGEKHAVETNTSGIPVCKEGSIVTLVGKSSVTTVKPHTHMDSSLMHINTSGVISVSYNTTVKPHGDKNTSVLSAENSSMPVDTNSETTAKPQSHGISSVISEDTCRPVLITSSDTASKPGSSEICVNTSRQILSTNNDTLEPHVSVNVLMCKENSNVTLNQVNDFTEESSTQMKSLNCTDDFTVAVVNMSAEVTSRPHTQMNSLNVAVHLTDTCEELQSQTNECIEMESYEDSGVIPLVSSSDIESNIQISNQSVSTNLNRSEININDKTDPEEMLGDQKCHINLSGGSLMTSAENAQSLKPSICEVWSPDSILDNFEMLGAGSDGCNQVKHPPPPSLLPPSSLPTPSSPLAPSSTPSSSSYVPNAPQDSAGIDGKEQTQEIWKQVEDPKTACTLYVNILTGNTMSAEDWLTVKAEDLNEPGPCSSRDSGNIATVLPSEKLKLQQMLSSHLDESSDDRSIKWRSSCSLESTDSADISSLLSSWSNPVFEKPKQMAVNAEVHHDTGSANRCFQSLYPTRFTKKMLQDVKVLGQIDNKFIACVLKTDDKNTSQAPNLMVLIDQHAAHERIRLEQLTDDLYLDDEADDCSIKQFQITPPKSLLVSDEEIRLMKSFRAEISRIGITFTCSGTDKNQVNIHTVPVCLVEREASELKRKRDSVVMEMVEVLLKDHIQLLKLTGGARSQLPQTLHKVLCSQACHGAVKFGDSLTLAECVELVARLSTCRLPFQCAHGRPAVTPLVDLDHLKAKLPAERVQRPNLWMISRNLDIHK